MKYDDVSWHSEGSLPSDLPYTAGATHAGMFLAWAWEDVGGSGSLPSGPFVVTALTSEGCETIGGATPNADMEDPFALDGDAPFANPFQ